MKNWLRNLAYAAWLVAALLAIANQLDRPAQAQAGIGCIVAADNGVLLLDTGDIVMFSGGVWQGQGTLPFPASQLGLFTYADADQMTAVTTSGVVYAYYGRSWHQVPPPCSGPTLIEPSTWGEVKALNK